MAVQKNTIQAVFQGFSEVFFTQSNSLSLGAPQVDFLGRKLYAHADTDVSEVTFLKAAHNLKVCFEYSLTLTVWDLSNAYDNKGLLDQHTQANAVLLKNSFTSHQTTLAIAGYFADMLEKIVRSWDDWVPLLVRKAIQDPGKAGFEYTLLYFRIVLAAAEVDQLLAYFNPNSSNTSNSSADPSLRLQMLLKTFEDYAKQADTLFLQRKAYSVTQQQFQELKNILTQKEQLIHNTLSPTPSIPNTETQPQDPCALAKIRVDALSKKIDDAKRAVASIDNKLKQLIDSKVIFNQQLSEKREALNKQTTLRNILVDIQQNRLLNTTVVKETLGISDETLNKYIAKQKSYTQQSYFKWGTNYAASFVLNNEVGTFTTEKNALITQLENLMLTEENLFLLGKEVSDLQNSIQNLKEQKTSLLEEKSQTQGQIEDYGVELKEAEAGYQKLKSELDRIVVQTPTNPQGLLITTTSLPTPVIDSVPPAPEASTSGASSEFRFFVEFVMDLLSQIIQDVLAFLEDEVENACNECTQAASEMEAYFLENTTPVRRYISTHFPSIFSSSVPPQNSSNVSNLHENQTKSIG